MKLYIRDGKRVKAVSSPDYNFVFDKVNGTFIRWGKTQDTADDPYMAPAPEILDLEISAGKDCIGCEYCYKANGPDAEETHNLSFDEFKTIFDKMPKTLTQIAFGIMNIDTNYDFFPMMLYAKNKGVIPNYTTNGFSVSKLVAEETAELCGAVAVSCHVKEIAYNAVKAYTDAGMTQVNIHQVLHQQNYEKVLKLLQDRVSDPRLAKLNAVVFLAYKPKGTNAGMFTSCTISQYRTLIEFAEIHGFNIGFDSCSAPAVFKAYEQLGKYEQVNQMIEPCESSLFSSYINTYGKFYPCSFSENELGWEDGLDVLNCDDFVKDIWNHPRTIEFRNRLNGSTSKCSGCIAQNGCRACPMFPITPCIKEHN
jgi:MoaA/NifB/PqqE/SkfB family radical SAM enzyme